MDRNQKFILLFGFIALASLYAYQSMEQPIGLGDVSVEEAARLIDDVNDLVILDVRTQAEFNDEHIEDAILIPVQELGRRINELSKDDPLLVYCRTGNRSRAAVTILEDNGFTKIYHMNGAITAWIAAGYPVV